MVIQSQRNLGLETKKEKGRRQVWDKDSKVMQGRSWELSMGTVRGPARGDPHEARMGSEHIDVGGGEACKQGDQEQWSWGHRHGPDPFFLI